MIVDERICRQRTPHHLNNTAENFVRRTEGMLQLIHEHGLPLEVRVEDGEENPGTSHSSCELQGQM